MTMKKADLEKRMAKKLDGKMKSGGALARFGQGSAAAKTEAKPAVPKLEALSCRIPAELASRLRERAVGFEGGMSAIAAQALEQWLAAQTTR
jgi:hypothetical protein